MSKIPKCRICEQPIDKEKTDTYIKNTMGYFHIECREKNTNKVKQKCAMCGGTIAEGKGYILKGQVYHEKCANETLDRQELYDFCCSTWGLTEPDEKLVSQIKYFRSQGYEYKAMKYTLRYFFEVKHERKTEEPSIGIIPYIYNEAEKYFKAYLVKQKEIEEKAKLQKAKEVKVVKVTKKDAPKKDLYEF